MANIFPQTYGPFKGMRFSPDPGRRDLAYAYYAKNMVPTDPVLGGPYVRRVSEAAFQIKGGGTTNQWQGVYRKRSGFISVAIVDGELYTWTAGTWARQVTTANLAAAAGTITLSATARCFAVTFNNVYVINDGVNQPFTWDGTAGAGGLTKLTNAPTKCSGAPTVYYAKLFWIKDVAANAADRSTIVWSEENAPNTGYEASGYTNVWTLGQNGSGALYAIVGTNSGLYYFRQDAIGVINGAVTPAFTTAGVHDDVSALVGTTCQSVLWYDGWIYFYDLRGRQWRLREGGRPEPLWLNLADSWMGPDKTGSSYNPVYWANALAYIAPFPWYNGVVFGAIGNAGNRLVNWVFSHETGALLCELEPQSSGGTPYVTTTMGELYDETNLRLVLAFGTATSSVILPIQTPVSGYGIYTQGDLVDAQLITGPYGSGENVWRFSSLSANIVVGLAGFAASVGSVAASYSASENPFGSFTAASAERTFTPTTTYQYQKRLQWGINSRLRWSMAKIATGSANAAEGWGIYSITMNAMPETMEADKV